MKLTVFPSNQFKKDYKRLTKQGKDLTKIMAVIEKLANKEKLDDKYRDHALTGNYTGCRECHVAPDWLLIYMVDNNELILVLTRTGSHAELF
jgi:mRNA interferase YafQ